MTNRCLFGSELMVGFEMLVPSLLQSIRERALRCANWEARTRAKEAFLSERQRAMTRMLNVAI